VGLLFGTALKAVNHRMASVALPSRQSDHSGPKSLNTRGVSEISAIGAGQAAITGWTVFLLFVEHGLQMALFRKYFFLVFFVVS